MQLVHRLLLHQAVTLKVKRPITIRNLNMTYFRQAGEYIGLPFVLSSHHARLNFASYVHSNGISDIALKTQLGHKSISVTQQYYIKDIGRTKQEIQQVQLFGTTM